MAWLRAAAVSEVEEKGVLPLEIGGHRIALFALDGAIFATGNVCTHQFALLSDGYVENGCIECPLHQGLFDIRTGKARGAPVTEDIPTYAVKTEDGAVYVDPSRPAADADADAAGPSSEYSAQDQSGIRAIVVLGAGQAGWRAAEAARQAGFDGSITMVGAEPELPYERPPLSKEFLVDAVRPEKAILSSKDRLAALRIELLSGRRAESVNRKARRIVLSDGSALSYDRLLIATGARVRRLSIPGAEKEGVCYLRTLADSRALAQALRGAGSVVVIGGGFIGLEVASSARKLGRKVTLLERDAQIMARVLPNAAAVEVAARAAAAGVEILMEAQVCAIEGSGAAAEAVVLSDGRRIAADVIVVGIGARPNSELAGDAGLIVRDGIVVDAYGRSSDPEIFAAGDVARYPLADQTGPARLESWHNAQEQAIAAGKTMAGITTAYDTVPWFWSDQFDTNIQIVGNPSGDGRAVRCERPDGDGSALFFLDAGGLVSGVVAFDYPSAIRRGRKLIAERQPVTPDDLAWEHRQEPAKTDRTKTESEEQMSTAETPFSDRYRWPESGLIRIPDWVYTDEVIYRREVERIFHGRTWNYVALEAEISKAGDFIRSYVGPTPVVVSRDSDGEIHVLENRCAHRAAEFCRELRGNAQEFVCPYHQWTYDLAGNLTGVPFRRGVGGKGGMCKDFDAGNHGVRTLAVTRRGGVVFASFADDMEPLEDYMGPDILREFDATFGDRKPKVLGYYRNTLPGNWKLYHENLKDPYHATLLHTFLVTFGLLVAGNKSAMICDATGRHGTMASAKSDGKTVDDDARKEMRSYREGMGLNEPRFMDFVEEFDSPWSVTMQTIWPNLIVQREMNTLGIRQIVPKGPNEFVMNWTMFGFEGDDEEMTRHRLRQGNLMGPAGFLGLEDNEAMKFVQDGMLHSTGGEHLVALDPETPTGTSDTLISESAIRAMYQHWREEMGL